MKTFLFIFLTLFTLSILGQNNTIYIDASAKVNGNGSQLSPWNGSTLTSDPWKANTTYFFKRGTTYAHSNKINIQVPGVTFAAYGVGAMPVIKQTTNTDNIIGSGSFSIQDIELVSPLGKSDDCGNQLAFWPGTGYLNVVNCKLHGGFQGIRVFQSPNFDVKILNCKIYDVWSDGAFIDIAKSLVASYDTIYNVNLSHPSGGIDDGDCIHLDDIKSVQVDHNLLDHTSQPGKFCLLLGSNSNTYIGNVIIEYNTMKRTRGGMDNTIFYSNYGHGSTIIFRNNNVLDALEGLQSRTYDMQVYNNIFANLGRFYECNAPTDFDSYPKIYNNTIYNCRQVVFGYGEIVDFHNNIVDKIDSIAFTGGNNLSIDYNDLFNINTFGGGSKGMHNITDDPLLNNPASYDFSLKSTSPCIKAGIGASQTVVIVNPPQPPIITDPCKSARDSVKVLLLNNSTLSKQLIQNQNSLTQKSDSIKTLSGIINQVKILVTH